MFTTLAAIALSTPAAFAHMSLATPQAAEGATYKAVLGAGHGCEGEATQVVRVTIPEGVIAVKPMPKAGWELETVTGAYEHTYDYYGTPMSEGVREIVWVGNLSDAHFDEFVFRGKLTDAYPEGSTVYFPAVQECADGRNEWVQIPEAGQNAHDLSHPAPALKIIAPAHAHH
jgi:uncharacterized protein YcnI